MTQSHPITLRELSLQYLSAMAGRKSEGSLRQWRSVLERHVWPLLGERTTLTEDDINAFIDQKRAEGFTARTVVNQSSLLRQLARYGQRTGVLTSVDLSRVQVQHLTPPKATEESPSDVLSREEQSRLRLWVLGSGAAKGTAGESTGEASVGDAPKTVPGKATAYGEVQALCRLGIGLGMETGMRRGELCHLRWQDVDVEGGVVRVPLSAALAAMMRDAWSACRDGGSYVLSGSRRAIDVSTLRKHFVRACDECGIRRRKFGVLRNTFILRTYESGMSAEAICSAYGVRSASGFVSRRRLERAAVRGEDLKAVRGTLRDVSLRWIESLRSGHARSTVYSYSSTLHRYVFPLLRQRRVLRSGDAELLGVRARQCLQLFVEWGRAEGLLVPVENSK